MEEQNENTPEEAALENKTSKDEESQQHIPAENETSHESETPTTEGKEVKATSEEDSQILNSDETIDSENSDKGDTEREKHHLEKLDLEGLTKELKRIANNSDWMFQNKQVQEIVIAFKRKLGILIDEKKDAFLKEGGSEMDFYFKPSSKNEFDALVRDYRKKRQKHLKEVEASQKVNLEKKQEIIEELKSLIDVEGSIKSTYQRFKSLRQSWYETGPVPKFQSQDIWRTYKHHTERFYDFLHLNKELRDLDFKHNYEEKLKIIEQAEKLVEEADIVKASSDLNRLHRLWKDDLGPVAKEHREALWNRFQAATKTIHKRRQEFRKNMEANVKANVENKNAILEQMRVLSNSEYETHNKWQKALRELNTLSETFKNAGYVPAAQGKKLWSGFRECRSKFTKNKNLFYKTQKAAYKVNVEEKRKLIVALKEILEQDNWNQCREEVKKIQAAWKQIGFVPKKTEQPLWKEFRDLSQTYFDRLRSGYQKVGGEDKGILEEKQKFLNTLEEELFPETAEAVLERVKDIYASWNEMGTFSTALESETNASLLKTITSLVNKVKMNGSKKEDLIFEAKKILYQSDLDNIQQELKTLNEQVRSARTEISQLENNFQFFSVSTDQSNPLYKKTLAKLTLLKKNMNLYEAQSVDLKKMRTAFSKQQEAEATSSSEEGNADVEQSNESE